MSRNPKVAAEDILAQPTSCSISRIERPLVRSLLSSALDDADPDARNVAELLDGIPGAHKRAQLGLRQAKAGETISVNEL